jgi:aryl-alcohol dehydrogenase-like predicted oxidoreductase
MDKPQLSDLKLSRLMLGTVQFGLSYGIANRSGQPSYETARSIIAAAYDGGVNCFDTAAGYGTSEEVLGRALAELGITDKVIVITKGVRLLDELLSEKDAEKIITESILRSLERLRLEVLPVCLFHVEEHFRHIGILLKLKDKELVRHVGVSVMTPDACRRIIDSGLVDAVQVPTNVFDRRYIRAGVFQEAEKRGVAVFVRSVYLQGLIFLSDAETPPELSAVIPVRRKLKSLADEAKMSFAELAVRCVFGIPGATSVLVGVDSLEQMRQNLTFLSKGPLDANLMKAIDEAVPDLSDIILMPNKWPKTKPASV